LIPQLTRYLLALAVKHGGALATLDHRVALSAVQGAKPEHLRLL
jgi:predicted nucleic acid-binding protein